MDKLSAGDFFICTLVHKYLDKVGNYSEFVKQNVAQTSCLRRTDHRRVSKIVLAFYLKPIKLICWHAQASQVTLLH
jgi:hypothetical protein